MSNKEKALVRIKVGLEETEEQGIVGQIATEMTVENAKRLLAEQERCPLVQSSLALLLDAYAALNGYRKAYFIQAFPYAEVMPYLSEEK